MMAKEKYPFTLNKKGTNGGTFRWLEMGSISVSIFQYNNKGPLHCSRGAKKAASIKPRKIDEPYSSELRRLIKLMRKAKHESSFGLPISFGRELRKLFERYEKEERIRRRSS